MKKIISIIACVCLLFSVIVVPVYAVEITATITFDSTDKRIEFDKEHQVWKENGVIVTNNKSDSSNDVADYSKPARFYQGSEVVIEYPCMTQIVVDANSSSYANAFAISCTSGEISVAGDKVTISLASPMDSYVVDALSKQARIDSITVKSNDEGGSAAPPPTETEIPSDSMEIVDAAFKLEDGESLPYVATLTGEVTYIETEYSAKYNDISIYILVEGTEYYYEILCYRLKAGEGEDASLLKEGDIIKVTGNIQNYNGIIEFVAGSTYQMIEASTDYPSGGSGTADDPDKLELTQNEDDPTIYEAEAYLEFYEGDSEYFFKTIAPANGVIGINVYAYDYNLNNVGYRYNVTNTTTGYTSGDIVKAADETEYNHYELVYVNKGDEILVATSTYDDKNPSIAPEAELGIYMCFYPLGSIECPQILEEAGEYAATLKAESQGHYYIWTVPTSGTITVKMNDASGWQYRVNKSPIDIDDTSNFYYSDIHSFNDANVVPSETINVLAGETVNIWVNTFDPNDEWVAPAGTVNWTLEFKEEISIERKSGDVNGDNKVNARDCVTLMRYINGWSDVSINKDNADVNADGKFNTRDYVILMRYINGWDVELK